MIESLRRNLSQADKEMDECAANLEAVRLADKEMDECAANLEAVRLANSFIMLLES